ncbi:hypothetical protein CCAL9344_07350 [Campylobacter sp. RM9344]|uniref:Uncharacterized protein n=1 Tax=Campylobacter californiensis TaxID=1032243 RepID=A0AAW3ZY18_9BACT|nr:MULTISPECIES: hypothetical protein [unclassified Campylobacter]MBE2985122.1 hypothetical protein [Campylobacter sp. RM6883]MBE2986411.1 hypothetical protein [Campylobacter sp. RM12919]MBE2988717.1 hypothetical protein [Campylobacter sp. RM12920]MBE2995713.1 hypothetical protein [Campylobacter sp. RM6913]MBE3029997.1 hypothetical protein [Campylobacter sp. RM9344]
MNQKICELFEDKKILLRDLRRVDLSEFCKKRLFEAYFGVDTKGYYEIVFIRYAKSRLLKKEALEICELCKRIETKFDTSIRKRTLFFSSQICSKSLEIFKQDGWRTYDFV